MKLALAILVGLLALPACGSGRGGRGGGGGSDDDDSAGPSDDDDDSTAADDDDAVDDDDTVDDDDATPLPPPDCGWNSYVDSSNECACEPGYEWCDAFSAEMDCCSTSNTFDVWITEANIQPWKDNASGEPWDWTGSLPDGLGSVIGNLVSVYAGATDFGEVIDAVLDLAPSLMSASVPPDAVFYAYEATYPIHESITIDNTVEPYWDERLDVLLYDGEELQLDFCDVDAVFDDQIQTVRLDLGELQEYAGRGPVVLRDVGRLWSLTIEVEHY